MPAPGGYQLLGGCLLLGGVLSGGLLRGCLVLVGSALGGAGVPGPRGVGIPVCTEADLPGEMATAADGTHPTGMHSCSSSLYAYFKTANFYCIFNMDRLPVHLREPCGHPVNVTEHDCQAYGCCWDPTHDELERKAHCFMKGRYVSENVLNENLHGVQFSIRCNF